MKMLVLLGIALLGSVMGQEDCDGALEAFSDCASAAYDGDEAEGDANEWKAKMEESKAAMSACFVDNGCEDPAAAWAAKKECKKAVISDAMLPAVEECLDFAIPASMKDWLVELATKKNKRWGKKKWGKKGRKGRKGRKGKKWGKDDSSDSDGVDGNSASSAADDDEDSSDSDGIDGNSASSAADDDEDSSDSDGIDGNSASSAADEDEGENNRRKRWARSGKGDWEEKMKAKLERKLAKHCGGDAESEAAAAARSCLTSLWEAKKAEWEAKKGEWDADAWKEKKAAKKEAWKAKKAAKKAAMEECKAALSEECQAELLRRKEALCECGKSVGPSFLPQLQACKGEEGAPGDEEDDGPSYKGLRKLYKKLCKKGGKKRWSKSSSDSAPATDD